MQNSDPSFTRRHFLRTATFAASLFTVRGAFAEELTRKTAWVEEGPFYPRKLPLDTDNDLIIVNDSITPAVGEITHLSGRVLDANGSPIKNAVIEIWQTDSTATYLQERDQKAKFDANFQRFGRFLTGSTGEYYFRTIKPVPYRGRPAPHIHFKIKVKGSDPWTTQLFIKGFADNANDGVYNSIDDGKAKESVTMDFKPVKDSKINELAARFDIIPGETPKETDHDHHGGPDGFGPPPGPPPESR